MMESSCRKPTRLIIFNFLTSLDNVFQVEFRCEYSPLQVKVWVEKDTKAKEVTPQPVPKIVKISCGTNHTVALTEEKKAYSWGFGGYGRLGHSETADELVGLSVGLFGTHLVFVGAASYQIFRWEEPWPERYCLWGFLQPGVE